MAKRTVNKSKFVRDLPKSLTAAEVVAAAKKEKINISEKYVYNIRTKMKARGGKAPGKRGRPPKVSSIPGVNGSAPKHSRSTDTEFVGAVLDMGLERARQLLDAISAAALVATA
jgi:hypothetical protein